MEGQVPGLARTMVRSLIEEVSLDPQMRRLYRPLPLFLTPVAPGRVNGDGKPLHFCLVSGREGLVCQDQTPVLQRGGILSIITVKVRTIGANERVSPTKEEGSQSGSPPVRERCSETHPDSPLGIWGD